MRTKLITYMIQKEDTHETCVSLETAKMLQKAGFGWACVYAFMPDSEMGDKPYIYSLGGQAHNYNDKDKYPFEIYSAPTLAVVQKWLREVKDINIYVCPGFEPLEEQWKMGWQNAAITSNIDDDDVFLSNPDDNFHDTYEKALETGIQKCLTILLEKNK